jgi:hypothetical protein
MESGDIWPAKFSQRRWQLAVALEMSVDKVSGARQRASTLRI